MVDLPLPRPIPSGNFPGSSSDSGGGFGGGNINRPPSGSGEDDESWEPRSHEAWAEFDPLRQLIPPGHYNSRTLYNAWRRLPDAFLRAQAWREREIAARLYALSQAGNWEEKILGLVSFGVGRRSWDQVWLPGLNAAWLCPDPHAPNYKRYLEALRSLDYARAGTIFNDFTPAERSRYFDGPLVAVITVSESSPAPQTLFANLRIDPLLRIGTLIKPAAEYGFSEWVPVVFEVRNFPERLSGQPSSSTSAAQILQSGQTLSGIKQGTLSAIVALKGSPAQEYLLSCEHVFGSRPQVIQHNGQPVASVEISYTSLDFSLAKMAPHCSSNPDILGLGMRYQAQPILPVYGLGVQFRGSISQRLEHNYINQVYVKTPSYLGLSGTPAFAVSASCMQGDSGTLILSGHQSSDPVSQMYARQPSASGAYPAGAVLGLLFAHTPADAYCQIPAAAYAVPVVDIDSYLSNYSVQTGVNWEIDW